MFVKLPENDVDHVATAKFMAQYLTERGKTFLAETFHPKQITFTLDIGSICSAVWIQPAVGKNKDEGTKKRYAALVEWDKKPTMYLLRKGLEIARHDWSKGSREAQEEGLYLKLLGRTIEEQSAAAEERKRQLFAGELDEKIIIWKGLNMNIEDYKVETQQLRVAKMLMERGLFAFHKNDKVGFVKVGPKPDQLIPVVEGVPIDLETGQRHIFTEAEYGFVWDKEFKPIYDRLQIPVEGEKIRYATERQKKILEKKRQQSLQQTLDVSTQSQK